MIDAQQLHIRYGQEEIVKGVQLRLAPGETLALLGPNGCGKTTLLKALCAIHAPHAGSVQVDGQDLFTLSAPERARRIAYVPQQHRLVFAYSVIDVVMMGRLASRGLIARPAGHTQLRGAVRRAASASLDRPRAGAGRSLPATGRTRQQPGLWQSVAAAGTARAVARRRARRAVHHPSSRSRLCRGLARHSDAGRPLHRPGQPGAVHRPRATRPALRSGPGSSGTHPAGAALVNARGDGLNPFGDAPILAYAPICPGLAGA